MKDYLKQISQKILETTGKKKVFLLVSGGVDSTVCFVLLNKILGPERVLGVHINSGLMRLDESEQVLKFLKKEGMNNLQIHDESKYFLSKLKGVSDPEKKRNIIGRAFLEVKDKVMKRLKLNAKEWIIAQGTIYPDTLETGETKNSKFVKTHHNRVKEILELQKKGLLLEPLAPLYKNEVRELGEKLGIPHSLVWRHPFPGPGLGVRLLCNDGRTPLRCTGVKENARTYTEPVFIKSKLPWEKLEKYSPENRVAWLVGAVSDSDLKLAKQYCTKNNLDKLRLFDNICTKFLIENKLYDKIWQMPVVLLPLKISGKPCVLMRPINSKDAVTASFAKIDQNLVKKKLWPKLKKAGAGALFYDITNKPPATIEWE